MQAPAQRRQAWLVRSDGLHSGLRTLLRGDVTRIGRDPHNDVAVRGANAAVVSARHVEIRREGEGFRLYDLASTNGAWVDGRRVETAELSDGMRITLGEGGPEWTFELEWLPEAQLAETVEVAAGSLRRARGASLPALERTRVEKPPTAPPDRRLGGGTAAILRRAVTLARHSAGRRWRRLAWALALALTGVLAWAGLTIASLRRQKGDVDRQLAAIESRLHAGGQDAREIRDLLERLERYQTIAHNLEERVLYQLTEPDREQLFIESELRRLLLEFGAERSVAPPEFAARVGHYVDLYQTADRQTMRQALDRARGRFERMQSQFEEANLPPDLAYVVLAESALVNHRESGAGAVGLWQLTPVTARELGLRVNAEIDERLDPDRSTEAAARYLRSLILEFGSGSSVLLALAAYNSGPTRVKRAVLRVEDPIAQRNFWYLYASETLPSETREYVPKILAAIVIGRNPERFGF
ncbi:MAG: transglycosylase SLT domain-containing protein [Acidobacteria bacterium]|nr:transglycosylase SLT domain-containing protein [Acidobacteriota bacterium]